MNYANIIEAVQGDGYAVMEQVIGSDDLKAMQGAFDQQIAKYEAHFLRNKPSDDYIEIHIKQVTMQAGSVLLFNSLTFHASGINHNGGQRRCSANGLRKSFMKPQFQWNQILGGNGFYNNPAPSLDAYYQEGIRRRAEREQRGVKTVYGIELKDN